MLHNFAVENRDEIIRRGRAGRVADEKSPVEHRVQESAEEHLLGQRSDGHSENHHQIRALRVLEKLVHGQRFWNRQQPRKLSQGHSQKARLPPENRASPDCPANANPPSARKDVAGDASPARTWRPAWPRRPASCSAQSPAARDSCPTGRQTCRARVGLCKTMTKAIEVNRNSAATRTSPTIRRSRPLHGGFSAPGLITTGGGETTGSTGGSICISGTT